MITVFWGITINEICPFLFLSFNTTLMKNNIKKKFGTICSSKVTSKIGGKRADWISVSAIWRISSLTFLCSFKLHWAKIIKSTAKDDKMAHNSRTRAKYHQVKIYGSVCKKKKRRTYDKLYSFVVVCDGLKMKMWQKTMRKYSCYILECWLCSVCLGGWVFFVLCYMVPCFALHGRV